MEYSIQLFQRPNARPPNTEIVNNILDITRSLTGKWFTANVPDDTLHDLQFHDAFCLTNQQHILSFLVFTSWDGMMYITLMGTRPGSQGQGLGSRLMQYFFRYTQELGFETAVVMTVPEDVNPLYSQTIHFYQKHGFTITKRYTELWEQGAIQLRKRL